MKDMVSGVRNVPISAARGIGETFRQRGREITAHIAPSISVQGVPGEYDFRKFLTPIFEGWRPVQKGSGGSIVGSLVVTTNKDDWKSSPPVYVNGIFGPERKPDDTSAWFTDLTNLDEDGHPPPITVTNDGTLPSKAVPTGQTTPNNLSVSLTQAADKRSRRIRRTTG